MASKLIKLKDGTMVEIEVEDKGAKPISSKSADTIKEAALDSIYPIVTAVCKPIKEVWKELNKDLSVEQAEIELGLGFEAEGNLYITKAKGNANLTIKFTLKPTSDQKADG